MTFKKKGTELRLQKLAARNIQRGVENRVRAEEENARRQREEEEAAAAAPDQSPVCCGRRIVKLQTLCQSLWCDFCDDALSMKYCESEQRQGLASVFIVRCHRCMKVFKINTDDKGPLQADGKQSLWSVNLKAALGCMDSGVGHEQLNKLFSVMNLPSIHRNTIIRAQGRVGESLSAVAKASCKEAILLEKSLTEADNARRRAFSEGDKDSPMDISPEISGEFDDPDDPRTPGRAPVGVDSTPRRIRRITVAAEPEIVDLTAGGDGGWDKRGNGFSYDSHGSRYSLAGALSDKIMAYKCPSNYCCKCARGATPGDGHMCAKNYEGSSKGMEAHAASEVIANNPDLIEAGVRIGRFIGDKDSSTMARLRRDCPHPIEKIHDLNHNSKGFVSTLYKLKKTPHTWLQSSYIDKFKRNIGYAIKQNKGNVEGVRAAIMNIEKHAFGEHEECGDWCKAKEDPDNYVYKHHPNQKKYCEEDFPGWRDNLHAALLAQASQAESLAPCGSTQVNESFNHMAVTRAPKSRFYSGTNAAFLRVSAAVCEKNIGSTYVDRVFDESLLSPSAFRTRLNFERKKQSKLLYQRRPDIKARRLFLKMQTKQKPNQDGLTYASGMATVMERASEATSVGETWLPDIIRVTKNCVPVIIDLETTGLHATDQIVQIAVKCGSEQQSWYMVPTKKITPDAAVLTGLRMFKGKLQHNGKCVPTTPPKEVAKQLLEFLRQRATTVYLVGHNIIRFDAPRIVKFLYQQGCVRDLATFVAGFSDTLPLLKQGKLKKQALLAKKFLVGPAWENIQKSAHNALTDCIVLDGLLNDSPIKVSPTALRDNMVSFRSFMERQAQLKRKKLLMPRLQCLVDAGLSKNMASRMALAGITVEELREEYKNNKAKGISVCLGVQVDGKPRVTVSKPIIKTVVKFFADEAQKAQNKKSLHK